MRILTCYKQSEVLNIRKEIIYYLISGKVFYVGETLYYKMPKI